MINSKLVCNEKDCEEDTLDAILIFESMSNDARSLKRILTIIGKMLGISFLKSTIVILTKRDKVTPLDLKARFGRI